jgi:oxygen-dependent protoporphyrinogen oxidase
MKHVIIVGGGITGLSAAYHLQEEAKAAGMPITYTLLESDSRLGGKIKTEYADGFTIDGGPDCFLSRKPWAIQLCRKLGLGDELLGTNDDKRKTFVLNKGKLTPLPDGVLLVIPTRFVPFATSRLITWHGKMRMGMDLFIPPRKDDGDETVANFIRRRLGKEALEKIAEPLMSGIHISDPEYQSLLGSFPRFREMELKHGSLIRAMISQRKPKGAHGSHGSSNGTNPLLHTGLRQITRMVGVPMPDKSATNGSSQPKPMSMFMTLRKGLGQFVNQLIDSLEGTLLTDKQAVSLELCSTNGHAPRYQVRTSDGETFEGDAVIMATPAYATATLMDGVNPALATDLRKIRYVTTSTVSMGFRLEDVGKPFGGFGFVIPRKENRKITGCTWSSTKFSYRVPDNHLLLRAFIGGPGHEHLAEQEDDALVAMVRNELRDTMGLQATPVLTRVFRWTKANPQYDVGHLDRVSEMHASCESQPGLFITGSAYDGVGVPDCVNHGHKAAKKAVDLLKQTSMVASAVEA